MPNASVSATILRVFPQFILWTHEQYRGCWVAMGLTSMLGLHKDFTQSDLVKMLNGAVQAIRNGAVVFFCFCYVAIPLDIPWILIPVI